ncbi:hypothetical protein SeMB42_g05991 [Synchytrium endobioticum]|nr:hypothetical protein SeMB42_g05991 [Synchytrium endobioticum]
MAGRATITTIAHTIATFLPNNPNLPGAVTSFNSLSVYAFIGLIIVTLLAATFQYFRFRRMRALYDESDVEAGVTEDRRRNLDVDTASIETLPAYFPEKLPEYNEEEQNANSGISRAVPPSPPSTYSTVINDNSTVSSPTSPHPTHQPAVDPGLCLPLALSEDGVDRRHILFGPSPITSTLSSKNELDVVKQVRSHQRGLTVSDQGIQNAVTSDDTAEVNVDEKANSIASSSSSPLIYPTNISIEAGPSTSSQEWLSRNSHDLPSTVPSPLETQSDKITMNIEDRPFQ